MYKYLSAFLLYILLQICITYTQDNSLQQKISLKLISKIEPYELSTDITKLGQPRFPLLIGMEFGKYSSLGDVSEHKLYLLSFFCDVNLYKHSVFLKFEFGSVYESKNTPNAYLVSLGLNFTPIKTRYHKLYLAFTAGLGVGKGGGGFLLAASPKYLFALTDFFGLSAGMKFFYTFGGSNFLGFNLGFQFFEN